MNTRPGRRFARPVIVHDENGSMILALLVIVILTSLIAVVLMVTISQQVKTRKAADFVFAGQSADVGVNDALQLANQMANLPATHAVELDVAHWTDSTHPRSGGQGDFTWSWYASPGASTADPTYVITSTGCRNKNAGTAAAPECDPGSARTVQATFTGTMVNGVDNHPAKTAYVLTPELGFGRALYADDDLVMQGASTAGTSYNSTTSNPNTGYSLVASNGLASFTSTAVPAGGVSMSNTQIQPSSERCSVNEASTGLATPCAPGVTHDFRPKFQMNNTAFIAAALIRARASTQPGCGGEQLKPWVASEAPTPGHLTFPAIGPLCFSSMNFDVKTTVDAPANDVYVTGPITVAPGITVNKANPTPVAATLTIFSSGLVVSIGRPALLLSATEVAWALWAPKALCATNTAAGSVSVYGSMVCNKIMTQGAFTARWDQALGVPPTPVDPFFPAANQMVIWDITSYQECSACQP